MSTDQERQTTTDRRRETFTRFFEEAEPRLRVALGAALGQDRGRDAASEALAYAWENWDRLQEMENPIGYLYRVGRSKVRERKQRFLRPVPDGGFPHIEPGLPVALEQLSDSQRVAVVLVHGFQWSHGEVAALLGTSTPTVATHVRRGLKKLQRSLKVEVS